MRPALAVLLAAAVLPLGCGTDATVPLGPRAAEYLEPTSPGNVVHNFIEAYNHKEAGPYAQLLAPEFAFKFQPEDAVEFQRDALTRDLDLAATQGLFTSGTVGGIQLILTAGDPEPVEEAGFPPGTVRVRLGATLLSIRRFDAEWVMEGDLEDLYLRPGDSGNGENPDHWFLIEWRDIPNPASSGPGTSPLADEPVPVIGTTWGRIKMEFLPETS
jgi:hypothetical protein